MTATPKTFTVIRNTPNEPCCAELQQHLVNGDYFNLLATIFGAFEDLYTDCKNKGVLLDPITPEFLKQVRSDLEYLNQHHAIIPKPVYASTPMIQSLV